MPRGSGIVVASRACLIVWNSTIGDKDVGFDIGILVCGRGRASIFDSVVETAKSCGLLVQSGGTTDL